MTSRGDGRRSWLTPGGGVRINGVMSFSRFVLLLLPIALATLPVGGAEIVQFTDGRSMLVEEVRVEDVFAMLALEGVEQRPHQMSVGLTAFAGIPVGRLRIAALGGGAEGRRAERQEGHHDRDQPPR